MDNSVTDSLNNWASKASRKNRQSSKVKTVPKSHPLAPILHVFEQMTVSNETVLDDLLGSNPKIATPPENKEKIQRNLRQKPIELECGPGEVLCLVIQARQSLQLGLKHLFPLTRATRSRPINPDPGISQQRPVVER